jgi:hypothetical protein
MALKEVPGMPITKELTMRMDNRSGSLGKVCRSLADQGINILAFQSIPSERTILVCIVVDKPAAAEAVLEKERITYAEGEVVQSRFRTRLASWHALPPNWAAPISTSTTRTAVLSQLRIRRW